MSIIEFKSSPQALDCKRRRFDTERVIRANPSKDGDAKPPV